MQENMILNIISTLMMKLTEAKAVAAEYGTNGTDILEKTEEDIRVIEEIFLGLEKWKAEVKEEIKTISEQLNDVISESSSIDELATQLQIVKQKVAILKSQAVFPLKINELSQLVKENAILDIV